MNKFRETRERWRGIVEQHQASGLSVAAFCRRARVPQSSFFAWRRKLRVEDSPRKDAVIFAEVQVAPKPACASREIELHLPGRRCIVVRKG